MNTRCLDAFFRPGSIAVIGASGRSGSAGTHVMRNLLAGEFRGPILPVNARHRSVLGVLCYESIAALPVVPELAVVCTPPRSMADVIDALGRKGNRAAIVLTADPSVGSDGHPPVFKRAMLHAAAQHGVMVLGPGSTGIQVPGIGLNASWMGVPPARPGRLALVSQSGAIAVGIVAWAERHQIGFSHVISTGDTADVDLAEILDFLRMNAGTRAVLLFIQSIGDARRFISAARAIARIKPVIAIKPGRRVAALGGERWDGLPLVVADDVHDAAIRRAGMLRVHATDELFDAARTLTHYRRLQGERLVILCNGDGPGEMAADALVDGGGLLSTLSSQTAGELGVVAGTTGSQVATNPIDIGRAADAARYQAAMAVLIKDPSVDALLVMHTPTPVAAAEDVAAAVARASQQSTKNVLACWVGTSQDAGVACLFDDAGIPVFSSPDEATRAFLHVVHYQRNQDMLLEIPSTPPPEEAADTNTVRTIIDHNIQGGCRCIDEERTAAILKAYGLEVLPTRLARDADEAVACAEELGFPVTLRLSAPAVAPRMMVGNMSFDLATADAVRTAARGITVRFAMRYPGEPSPSMVVQPMVRRPDALVLAAGIGTDPLYGRVIRFGYGGVGTDVPGNVSVALPPLNMSLAGELIARSRVGEAIRNSFGESVVDEVILRSILVRLAQMATDFPEIVALDMNPLLADRDGGVVLDARIGVEACRAGGSHLAIRPYPRELEERLASAAGRTVLLRPVRPEDEPAYRDMLNMMSREDLRLRFCGDVSKMPPSLISQFVHIDYDREMTFVAIDEEGGRLLGAVEGLCARDRAEAEFSVIVRSDLQGSGLGGALMNKLIGYTRSCGMMRLFGLVQKENEGMLALARRLGFRDVFDPEDDMVTVELSLQKGVAAGTAGRCADAHFPPGRSATTKPIREAPQPAVSADGKAAYSMR